MQPLGLPSDVAERRQDIVGALLALSPEDQVEMLALLWHQVDYAEVTDQYKSDLGEITAAFKRVQLLSQQYNIAR